MADVFVVTSGELADRLLAALMAGDSAGGDKRGKQSAGILVVKEGAGYGGDNDRSLDLRVDDDSDPVTKLATLVRSHHLFFGKPRKDDQLVISESLARELQAMMQKGGYWKNEITGAWDDACKTAFDGLIGNENLEERWRREDPDKIDRVALEYLRERFK
jgi:uncharacterized Ntn-hydrolase superfamily protein